MNMDMDEADKKARQWAESQFPEYAELIKRNARSVALDLDPDNGIFEHRGHLYSADRENTLQSVEQIDRYLEILNSESEYALKLQYGDDYFERDFDSEDGEEGDLVKA